MLLSNKGCGFARTFIARSRISSWRRGIVGAGDPRGQFRCDATRILQRRPQNRTRDERERCCWRDNHPLNSHPNVGRPGKGRVGFCHTNFSFLPNQKENFTMDFDHNQTRYFPISLIEVKILHSSKLKFFLGTHFNKLFFYLPIK